ncbi:hypothetical protein DGWBC_1545 [Dehalogenimonas sp. WBC-2]|nr:hypothetical protein DGWBC_1545 [Dehalogenimonas sp. WBC-2]
MQSVVTVTSEGIEIPIENIAVEHKTNGFPNREAICEKLTVETIN